MFDENPDRDWNCGGWRIIDPRPIQQENPYTFFVPSNEEKQALEKGDLVKLWFESLDPEIEILERMWVIYGGKNEDECYGQLDNEPCIIEGLSVGDTIKFQDFHIISVWDCKIDNVDDEERYFARCYVDPRVLDDGAPIGRMERRKPKKQRWWHRNKCAYPDTGWHIYAEGSTLRSRRMMHYLAIGLVLNQDDRFKHLLHSPVGTKVVKDGDEYRVE